MKNIILRKNFKGNWWNFKGNGRGWHMRRCNQTTLTKRVHHSKMNLDDDNLQNFGILFITTNEMIRQKKTTEIFCKIISI